MPLEIKHIEKSFGDNLILKNISFTLETSQIYVLMGANGSGKTTLFNIITGFLQSDKGDVYWNSKNLFSKKPHTINKIGISRTFQDLRLIKELTVKENVLLAFKNQEGEKWWKALMPKSGYNKEQHKNSIKVNNILKETFIDEISEYMAGEISYGQQKLLTLACCIANDAELFLLDEPVAGINPVYREKLVSVIEKLKYQGKTFLIIEHNSDFITEIADKILFLRGDTISEYESYSSLKNDKQVMNSLI